MIRALGTQAGMAAGALAIAGVIATTGPGAGGIVLFHGTDTASAAAIATGGLDVEAAVALGGGDVFWATTSLSDATIFAAANPTGGVAAVLQVEIPQAVFQSLARQGLASVSGSVYTFGAEAWEVLNTAARFSVLP